MDSTAIQLVSNGVNQATAFLAQGLSYGLEELGHGISDPAGYVNEQIRKLDFTRSTDQSPYVASYHQGGNSTFGRPSSKFGKK